MRCGKKNHAARGDRAADDALQTEQNVGKQLADNNIAHAFKLHAEHGGDQNEDTDDIIGIFS